MGVNGDWTWVLERQCPQCLSDVNDAHRDQLAARVRVVGGAWRELLNRGKVVQMLRDDDDRTWTPLQYGCHVRDVFDRFEDRARLMLKKRKTQTFSDWDQEQEAIKSDYASQDPAKVAYTLASNAGKYADLLDRVHGEEWAKTGNRSDGATFTVESLTRYMLHDVEHHLWDARDMIDG